MKKILKITLVILYFVSFLWLLPTYSYPSFIEKFNPSYSYYDNKFIWDLSIMAVVALSIHFVARVLVKFYLLISFVLAAILIIMTLGASVIYA